MESLYTCSQLSTGNIFVDDLDLCRRRVENSRDTLFNSSQFLVRLIRIAEGKPPVTEIVSESDLEERLLKTNDDSFRILWDSIFTQSPNPLQCTVEAMMRVVEAWQISGMFFDVLLKFGDKFQVFEESSGFRQSYQCADGSFELCYQLMYIEPSGRPDDRNPWSFRQTGVYHKYQSNMCSHKIILLHPNDEPVLQNRLEKHAISAERWALSGHPLNVHLVALSSYLLHWQDYIESLAATLDDVRKHIIVTDTKRSKFDVKELQKLKNVEDKVVCRAYKCLGSTRVTIQTLMELNAALPKMEPSIETHFSPIHQRLRLLDQQLEGHMTSAEILAQRVNATLGLLTNIIDLQNRGDSGRISSRILSLTRKSVDDNATVRVVTICTLIYLPASFMASFFGMNFFEFRSDIGSLRASPNFWVYVTTTVPLTFITVGAWYLYKLRHDRIRKGDEEKAE